MKNLKHRRESLLKRVARAYLAAKNPREKARLLGRQQAGRARLKKARLMINPWEKWELKLLGTVSDYELARRVGRSQGSVLSKRRSLGIAPNKARHAWTAEEIEFIRQNAFEMTDHELSRQLKLRFFMVKDKRIRLGLLKRTGSPPRKLHWPAKNLKLLGKLSDYEIARRLKVVPSTIRIKRKALGIPAQRTIRRWTRAEEKLLGRWSDEEIARRLGRTAISVWHRRCRLNIRLVRRDPFYWRPEEVSLLGTMTDKQAAKILGRTFHGVTGKRRLSNIPSFTPKPRPWTRREIVLLGKSSDQKVAVQLGRTQATVRWKRSKLGIAAAGNSKPA